VTTVSGADLPAGAPLLLIAGRGDLPQRVAARCRADGRAVHVIVLKDHGNPAPYAALGLPHLELRLGQGGTALRYVRDHDLRHVVLAGGVRRPSLTSLWPDAYTARFVARVGMRALGDDGLLRAVIAQIEAEGLCVHPVQAVLDEAVGRSGLLGHQVPDESAWRDIRRGLAVGQALGAVDVGQSVVVQQGVVLGLEAIEGTDALLARCGGLRLDGPGGVLVKVCKPGQDQRADLPTLGETTVTRAHAAGLRGIAYQAGAALVLSPEAMAAKADALGLFVIGLDGAEADEPSTDAPSSSTASRPIPAVAVEPSDGGDPTGPLVFLIAGEPSGDVLGARLMAALRARLDGRVRFAGVGGEAMAEQGLDSLVPQKDLAIMGFLEVVPKIPVIRRHLRRTVETIEALAPAAVVTIDSWGFTGRVAKRLADRGSPCPRIHYVAPMVWAWKESRKFAVAARVHHLLTLWPFECAYFAPLGLGCTHVGHAVIESGVDTGDGARFRAAHGIAADAPVLVVLPGSRRTEVAKLLPVFRRVVARLAAHRPGLRVVLPTVATVAETVADAVADWPVPVVVVRGSAAKADAFAAGSAALAASGTVSLELAMAGLPHVIAYKVNPLSAALFRVMTPLRYAGPVNILLDREAVPERLQDACTTDAILRALVPLLDDHPEAEAQRTAFAEARSRLSGGDGGAPSTRAASVIINHLAHSPEEN